ncbi:hypothetical protein BU16DRAFT_3398 [Lophium mytilinum]|uniref:Uncharacterized protein n=1 Tax=Lophium mytilinum TaxID=390894 RepID=A0A6A6RBU0_9PEZI|nr:hypothetical protein BU16DRAFT_3398 [Lophium mytilinum]
MPATGHCISPLIPTVICHVPSFFFTFPSLCHSGVLPSLSVSQYHYQLSSQNSHILRLVSPGGGGLGFIGYAATPGHRHRRGNETLIHTWRSRSTSNSVCE